MFKAATFACAFALLSAGQVCAQTGTVAPPETTQQAQPAYLYALGLQYQIAPDYPGSAHSGGSLSPVWALRWGRLRVSNGGGGALMGFGARVYGSGASADLLQGKSWRLGVSLRYDHGRYGSDMGNNQNLPDVPRTLRGRLFASDDVNADLQLSAHVSPDLLGRGGGVNYGVDADLRLRHTALSEWTLGLGLSGADATYMQSYFGVTPAAAQADTLTEYHPGGGLQNAYATLAYTQAIDRHWVVRGAVADSRLLGPAAASPLDQRPNGVIVSVRLAYRH